MPPLDKLHAAPDQNGGAVSPNRGSHRGAGAPEELVRSQGGSLLAVVRLLARVAARDWLSQALTTGAVEVIISPEDKQRSSVAPSAAESEGRLS
jgi:hypothetical protein